MQRYRVLLQSRRSVRRGESETGETGWRHNREWYASARLEDPWRRRQRRRVILRRRFSGARYNFIIRKRTSQETVSPIAREHPSKCDAARRDLVLTRYVAGRYTVQDGNTEWNGFRVVKETASNDIAKQPKGIHESAVTPQGSHYDAMHNATCARGPVHHT